MTTHLSYKDFVNPNTIVTEYFNEVKTVLGYGVLILPYLETLKAALERHSHLPPSTPVIKTTINNLYKAYHFTDQTAKATLQRLEYFHPNEAKRYRDHRVQIINVWRPLRGPIYDHPLVMCDYQSIAQEDRVPTDIVFPDYLGETYNFYPNATHRLYYLDGQMPDEVCLIKCFDSSTFRDSGIAQFCAHGAFPYIDKPKNTLARESIEVRCFVFYKERR